MHWTQNRSKLSTRLINQQPLYWKNLSHYVIFNIYFQTQITSTFERIKLIIRIYQNLLLTILYYNYEVIAKYFYFFT